MFTEERMRPVSQSTTDGTATPTASAGPAAPTAATSWPMSVSALVVSVGASTGSLSAVPSSTATAVFVPPTSTPMSRRAIGQSRYPVHVPLPCG